MQNRPNVYIYVTDSIGNMNLLCGHKLHAKTYVNIPCALAALLCNRAGYVDTNEIRRWQTSSRKDVWCSRTRITFTYNQLNGHIGQSVTSTFICTLCLCEYQYTYTYKLHIRVIFIADCDILLNFWIYHPIVYLYRVIILYKLLFRDNTK